MRRVGALFLAGCGCPSFDEMTVDDRTDMADFAFIDDIDAALADFAAWTGRDGVCVPEVRVVETIDGETAAGIYQGPSWPILVDRGSHDPHTTTVHELCHALDHQEGHTDPELFPPVEADSNYYTEALREREGFARACDDGPYDLGLTMFVEDACGFELRSPATRYLDDEVWTAFSRTSGTDGAATWALADGALGLETGFTIYDTVAADGRYWLLVDWFVWLEDRYALGVVEIDPATGALVGERVRLPLENDVWGLFARSDAGLVVLATDSTVSGARAYSVADGVAVPLDLPVLPIYPYAAALSEGVLYASGYDETWETTVRAWSLESRAPVVVLAPEGSVWGLHPTPGGVEARQGGWIVRLRDGVWERTLDLPDDVYGYARLSEHERLFFVGNKPIVHDEETDAWRLPPGACEARALEWSLVADDPQGDTLVLGGWWATPEAPVPFTRLSP